MKINFTVLHRALKACNGRARHREDVLSYAAGTDGSEEQAREAVAMAVRCKLLVRRGLLLETNDRLIL